MDDSQEEFKIYKPWNWRFILAVLGVILFIVSIVFNTIDSSGKIILTVFNRSNRELLKISSILTIIASILILTTTLGEFKWTAGIVNNNLLLSILLTVSIYTLLYLLQIADNSGMFLQTYIFKGFATSLATITSAVMIYFS